MCLIGFSIARSRCSRSVGIWWQSFSTLGSLRWRLIDISTIVIHLCLFDFVVDVDDDDWRGELTWFIGDTAKGLWTCWRSFRDGGDESGLRYWRWWRWLVWGVDLVHWGHCYGPMGVLTISWGRQWWDGATLGTLLWAYGRVDDQLGTAVLSRGFVKFQVSL